MVNNSTQIVLAIAIATVSLLWSMSTPAQTSGDRELCTFHNAVQQSSVEPSELGKSSLESSALESSHTAQAPVIILGRIPEAPYVVAVPKEDDVTLDTVRQCVSDAFQTRSRSGTYIRAGAFRQRSTAEELSRHLRTLNLDARVIYLP